MNNEEIIEQILDEIRMIRKAQIEPQPLVDIPTAARLTGVCENTIKALIARGVVSQGVYKIGRSIRLDWQTFLKGMERKRWLENKKSKRRTTIEIFRD